MLVHYGQGGANGMLSPCSTPFSHQCIASRASSYDWAMKVLAGSGSGLVQLPLFILLLVLDRTATATTMAGTIVLVS